MNYKLNLPQLNIDGSEYKPRFEIARGGMGAIFTYKSTEDEKVVVVKIPILENKAGEEVLVNNLSNEEKYDLNEKLSMVKNSFNYEAELMRKLNKKHQESNSNFPRFLAYDPYTPCIAMKYENGKDLEFIVENLRSNGKDLPFEYILYMAKQIYSITDEMHKSGYIHNDLKLANIRLRRSNQKDPDKKTDGTIVLLDLGIALPVGTTIPYESGIGTIKYSSPDLNKGGKLTEASDVYSLALNLFELITGKNNIADFPALYYQREITTPEEIKELIKDIHSLKEEGKIGKYKLIDSYKTRQDKTPGELKEIIEESLNPNPTKRPKIEEILNEFIKIERKYRYKPVTNEGLIKHLSPYMLTRLPESKESRRKKAEKGLMLQGIESVTEDTITPKEFSLDVSNSVR